MIENQYIDIFKQYQKTIDSKSANGINKLRNFALNSFQKIGFPKKELEDYKYFDVAQEFVHEYGLNLNRVPFKGNPYIAFKCEVPNLPTDSYFVLNDLFNETGLAPFEYPKGVFIGSLIKFAELHPEIIDKYYGKAVDLDKDGVAAFNSMFAQDGFVVYVPKGIILEKAIQLINILKSDYNYLVNRRVLIIIEDGAQAKLLSCDHTVDDSQFLTTQVMEVFVGENAVLDIYDLEENSDKVVRLNSVYIKQNKNSNVLINSLTLNCGKSRNDYHVDINGEHSEVHIYGMVIADRKQYVDNFVIINHNVPNCQSTQLFKYVLQDEAVGSFCGRIRVEKDAQKTQAFQTNNNLCTSPNARMYSKPQLEIYADDVKCSHGLTTGELDENALFYLRARGLSKDQARLMLMQAFMIDVIEHVRIEQMKARLTDLVERRFNGEMARCGNCTICK